MHLEHIVLLAGSIWFGGVLCQPGDKARAKCQEYAQYVYSTEHSPVLHARSQLDKVSTCGMVEVPLVVGGVKAKPKEFPHMVVIGHGESFNDPKIAWNCGGTLISENFVLTAAHCLDQESLRPQKIRMGEVDFLSDEESEIQERKVVQIISHPRYKHPEKYYDIALLKLDTPVEFTAYVRPACLATDAIKESKAIASGFGKTSFDADEGSKYLLKVSLSVIANNDCEKYFKQDIQSGNLKHGITPEMFCAGELEGGKDTCQGDSGGPMQVALAKPYCMYNVVGVVSFGKFCGFANMPAIYTRVSSYVEWIENIVWP